MNRHGLSSIEQVSGLINPARSFRTALPFYNSTCCNFRSTGSDSAWPCVFNLGQKLDTAQPVHKVNKKKNRNALGVEGMKTNKKPPHIEWQALIFSELIESNSVKIIKILRKKKGGQNNLPIT